MLGAFARGGVAALARDHGSDSVYLEHYGVHNGSPLFAYVHNYCKCACGVGLTITYKLYTPLQTAVQTINDARTNRTNCGHVNK